MRYATHMTDAGRTDTRTQFIAAARRLFAERGYYGVSIAAVAQELGLTKQALLHHFGSKEKLYGEVLAEISDRFMERVETASGGGGSPVARLDRVLAALHEYLMHEEEDARIIARELLDNQARAARSRTWYLRPFLDAMVDLARDHPHWAGATKAEAFAGMYQLIGAVNYFAVSGDTLKNMYGKTEFDAISASFAGELTRSLDRKR